MSEPNTGTDIALLIGPTGVGKTSLTVALRKRILTTYHDAMLEDPSFIPVVLMEAPASGEILFSWRIFYIRLGVALAEPEMGKKVRTELVDGRTTIKHITSGTTVAGMRIAIENALTYRRTLLVIIDEAVHMFRNCNPTRCATHMDALKSLSNISGVTLALVGSYDLYNLASLSGQLARRSAIVHMKRYIAGDASDEKSFRAVVKTLQSHMPLLEIPNLVQYTDVLQQACVGCVGILKDTLTRALALTLRNDGKWKDEFLERSLLSQAQIRSILEEVLEGERLISNGVFGVDSCRLKA
jgi:hypothetical protein